MVVKPSINFLTRDSDSKLIVDTGIIITSVTGNRSFPTPDPTIETLTAARDAFVVAVEESAHRDREMIAVRKAKRAELASLLRQLANYVESKSDGDMTALLSSGFPVQKPNRTPVGPVATPGAAQLRHGATSGSLAARSPQVKGASAYNWRLARSSAPTVYVQAAQTTGARYTFDDLTAGQSYNVELNALGSAGESNWSNPSTLMVI
jgi:hypothetical protein